MHQDPTLTPEERAQALLKEMTQDEKFSIIHGHPELEKYIGNVPENKRLNIPSINLQDGPQGVGDGQLFVTAFPGALTVAATFDIDSAKQFGRVQAEEQKTKGTNVLLGPMMNIARVPQGGRNFESLGEDTYLSGELAYNIIQGIQGVGNMIACAKHYAMNNQELNRSLTSADVDQRTMNEIYLPQFQRSVEAGVGSFMCGYNRINDTYACENYELLNEILKKRMNFTGWVMSDWYATHSAAKAANNGLDQEMPICKNNKLTQLLAEFFGDVLKFELKEGRIQQSRIDNMVYRIVLQMFKAGIFDNPNNGSLKNDARSPEHTKVARELVENSTVLLRNINNLLPLDISKIGKIAIIGDQASQHVEVTGGGSGHVIGSPIISPLDGIKNYLKGKDIQVEYASTSQINLAQKYAQTCDVAIVFVSTYSQEGTDRKTLALSKEQDDLINTVQQLQKRKQTIVVITTPGASLMPWIDKVQAVLETFYPGQEFGNAITNLLFGLVNPSGRLPLTFPIDDLQIPTNKQIEYPGINNNAQYLEGLFVGYRWYDNLEQLPLFPFGFGLSYTKFQYSQLSITQNGQSFDLIVQFTVKNIGQYDGSDVPQLYIQYPQVLNEPPRQLKGFTKVFVKIGQIQTVALNLSKKSFQYWNMQKQDYDSLYSRYVISIGTSSYIKDQKLSYLCNIQASGTTCQSTDNIYQKFLQ